MVSSKDIQTDNGFVRIHPAILELLARQTLSGREFRCLMFLFRKTYGYHKKEDRISLSQWEQGTGIPRTRVGAVLTELAEKKIVTKTDNGANRPATWSFNKYFETWQTGETVTLEGDSLNCGNEQTVTPTGDRTVTLEGTTLNGTVPLEGDKTVTLQGDHKRKKDITPTESANADAQPNRSIADQYHDCLEELKDPKANRPAILHRVYELCFGREAPAYSYLGSTARQVGGAGRLAQLMFERVTNPPTGDILAHIIAAENLRKKRNQQTGGNREIGEIQFASNGGDIYG